jgi:hypothetical protein
MTDCSPRSLPPVIAQLRRAWNARDLDGVLACFQPDYESIHPLHPERNAWGLDGPRWSWGALMEAMSDFRADLLRWSVSGATAWTEWRWTGSPEAGGAFTAGGVIVFGLVDDLIAWARIYTETVQVIGPDWEAALQEALIRASA